MKPLTRVAYVPSTCLMARRSALENVIGFDENLRFGEDVDLVWRLSQIGSIRYDAAITAEHQHPSTIGDLIKRRIGYGSSAAPLDRRHPGWVAPTNCSPYTAGAWMAMATLELTPLAFWFPKASDISRYSSKKHFLTTMIESPFRTDYPRPKYPPYS